MAFLFVYIPICFAIAYFLGRKRQIGLGWSLFFSFFLSPIIGFITTMLSPKYYDDNPEPSSGKRVFGWIVVVLCALITLSLFMQITTVDNPPIALLNALGMSIGLIGAGAYLIGRGKGKSYNSTAIQEVDQASSSKEGAV